MDDKGLDADGFIRREGDLRMLQPAFAGIVADYLASVRAAFGPSSRRSRGNARGRS
jgi:uncharacterized protein